MGVLTETGSATLNITGTGFTSLRLGDLIFDNSGRLWISAGDSANGLSNVILRYDSATAALNGDAPTVFQALNANDDRANGLTFDSTTNTLYGYSSAPALHSFYTIDQSTGTIGTIINNTDPSFTQNGDLTAAFDTPTVTPEPGSITLLIVGLCGGALFLRKRPRHSKPA